MGRGPMALCLARLSPVGPRGQWQEELEELTHSSALSLTEGGNRVLLLLETSIPAQRESACLPAAATDRCVAHGELAESRRGQFSVKAAQKENPGPLGEAEART